MKKMFRLLENVNVYNSFCEVTTFEHVNGNEQDLYIRLIQKNAGGCTECDNLRWIPAALATLSLTFDSIDSANVITRVATMVYPNEDRSIWKVTILAGETINGAMKAVLTENGKSETLLLDGRLVATGTGNDRFFC
jgi:hypothetical protein